MADQDLAGRCTHGPGCQKILGLKSMVHFRADFAPIAEEILVVKAPGAFVDQPETLPHKNLSGKIGKYASAEEVTAR